MALEALKDLCASSKEDFFIYLNLIMSITH